MKHWEQPLETPVLLIIFNRADTTRRVLDAIRQVRPTKLYVAADGPRAHKTGEADRCAEARAVATEVDWPCDVKTLFREENVGCGHGPAQAISWLFEQEETGIIIEDDILATRSFFYFCQDMLRRYAEDQRVTQVSGMNFQDGWVQDPDYDVYFSEAGPTWGWATWRRAWQHFDYQIPDFETHQAKGYLKDYFWNNDSTPWVLRQLGQTFRGEAGADWWDYQWLYAQYMQHGLAVVPNVNLAANIGFDANATHTTAGDSRFENKPTGELNFPLRVPPFVLPDREADQRYFKRYHEAHTLRRIKNRVKGRSVKFLFNKYIAKKS